MTDIEAEARRRLNEARGDDYWGPNDSRRHHCNLEAMCIVLEELAAKDAELEAFRREVSEAVEQVMYIATKANYACERGPAILEVVSRFILPKPVDPLVEAIKAAWPKANDPAKLANELREAFAACRIEIRRTNHD